jgi:hypothetical protein
MATSLSAFAVDAGEVMEGCCAGQVGPHPAAEQVNGGVPKSLPAEHRFPFRQSGTNAKSSHGAPHPLLTILEPGDASNTGLVLIFWIGDWRIRV